MYNLVEDKIYSAEFSIKGELPKAKPMDEIDEHILVCKWIDTSDNKKAVVELWNEFQGEEGEGSLDYVYPNNNDGWEEMLEVKGADEFVCGLMAGIRLGIDYRVNDPVDRWMFYDTFKGIIQPISLKDFVHSGPIRSDSLAIYLLDNYRLDEIEQKFKEK